MYQISKSKEGKVLEVYKSHNPRRQLSKEIQQIPSNIRPNWSDLTDTQGVHFDTMDGFTFWVHKIK